MINRWLPWLSKRAPLSESRWVVIDVETTGLDPDHDDLLCIAAMAVRREGGSWRLDFADHFEVVLKQEVHRASESNVLLHGIGWGAQQQGRPRSDALSALRAWVGDALLIAFHAEFDRAFIERAHRLERVQQPAWTWMDLADVLPGAFPRSPQRSLDGWMSQLGVQCVKRHQAAADVWATAQLFLMADAHMPDSAQWKAIDWLNAARQGRWLRRTQSAG